MSRRITRTARILACAAATSLLLAGCGGAPQTPGSSTGPAKVSGPIEMWTRAVTSSQSQALVKAWNETHENKVNLTVVPTENYLQKVGVAAGGNQLPCIMASDVVYMPNFVSKNLYADITARVKALPYASKLAPGHINISSKDGKIYGVPHNVAVSALFTNEVVLKNAGIDPSKKVASLEELAKNAEKVAKSGDGMIGLYYTGSNAGSLTFTHFPAIWASGGKPLNADGTKSDFTSAESVAVFTIFNQMFTSGAVPPSVKTESGATRNEVYSKGKTGYMLASNSVLETVKENDTVKIGVQGIPGAKGGESTFIGGDSIGITSSCKTQDAAWDFLQWTLSEAGQVDVYAKMHQMTVRSDLADNQYAKADPRLVALNELVGKGDTPKALNYGQTFNDPNGPALGMFQAALFGNNAKAALEAGAAAVDASLTAK